MHSLATIYFPIYPGPAEPTRPIEVAAVNITLDSVTVQWVVSYLAYTPERYLVLYGTSNASLDRTSDVVLSTADLAASNETYNISVNGLEPNRKYYFKVYSSNTFDSVETAVMTFKTAESGMYARVKFSVNGILESSLLFLFIMTSLNSHPVRCSMNELSIR